MGRLFRNRSVSPIGIDINSWEIRAVQLSGEAAEPSLYRAAALPRVEQPSPSAVFEANEAKFIAQMLRRRGFIGNRLVITAPIAACKSHVLSLPDRTSGSPIDMIARAEISRTSRNRSDELSVATWYLPERGRSEQGMSVVCEQSDIDGRLDALGQAGLEVIAVDLEEFALQRSAAMEAPGGEPEPKIDVILQVGWDVSFGVLLFDGVVVYTRRMTFGVSDIVLRLADRCGISPGDAGRLLAIDSSEESDQLSGIDTWAKAGWTKLAKALASEIDTSVTYVSHAYRQAAIGGVILAGFGAQRRELRELLDEQLGMNIESFGDSSGSESLLGNQPVGYRGRFAIALGLAGRFDS